MPPRQPNYRDGRPHRDFLVNVPASRQQLADAICAAWPGTSNLNGVPLSRVADLAAIDLPTIVGTTNSLELAAVTIRIFAALFRRRSLCLRRSGLFAEFAAVCSAAGIAPPFIAATIIFLVALFDQMTRARQELPIACSLVRPLIWIGCVSAGR